ncbi:MAG: 2-C-methyl-D-erythritol 4-phosphate cytidylyltransferase [Acidobacteriota bacterium]|nr:2-C-methyl-D-erythritol 4-phosphate cytidylyltransferase [Acidobacteriota bacterium]
MKTVVIIPAAGLGTRMAPILGTRSKKLTQSKQFTDLAGVPILFHTLRKFASSAEVSEIYLALRKNEMAMFRSRLEKEAKDILQKPVEFVEGGEHRQHTVANAISRLTAAADDIVLVHDAVRPFVTHEIIRDVILAAQKHGAAIAGLPAVDTIKQVERTAVGALVTATLPRERIVIAQTPQGFRYEILKKAFEEAAADGFIGTDEASLVERSGQKVMVVMGSPKNIKITTPGDMELAEFYQSK